MGFSHSRRDDLESLAYSLLYLVNGQLPWQFDEDFSETERWKAILKCKLETTNESFSKKTPAEYLILLSYTKKLLYDQAPDYGYMKGLLKKFVKQDAIHVNFDWFKVCGNMKKSDCGTDQDDRVYKKIDDKWLMRKISKCEFSDIKNNRCKSVNCAEKDKDSAVNSGLAHADLDKKEHTEKIKISRERKGRIRFNSEICKKISEAERVKNIVFRKKGILIGKSEHKEENINSEEGLTERGELPELKDRKIVYKNKECFNSTQNISSNVLCIII